MTIWIVEDFEDAAIGVYDSYEKAEEAIKVWYTDKNITLYYDADGSVSIYNSDDYNETLGTIYFMELNSPIKVPGI